MSSEDTSTVRLFNGRNLDGWQPQGGAEHEWAVLAGVRLDPSTPKRFAIQPGEGIFFNGPTGKTANLHTVVPDA